MVKKEISEMKPDASPATQERPKKQEASSLKRRKD